MGWSRALEVVQGDRDLLKEIGFQACGLEVYRDKAGKSLLDLDYEEDVGADVDMNVVMTGSGKFVEVQGTGEESTFSRAELDSLVKLASRGIKELVEFQNKALRRRSRPKT